MTRTTFIAIFTCFMIMTCFSQVSAEQKEITFWTTEVEADRLQTQGVIAENFMRQFGIKVTIVPVKEDQFVQRTKDAHANGSLPDVMYHPLDYTFGLAEAGLLDTVSATQVVEALGRNTFMQGPLKLMKKGDGYIAAPIDGWGQLVIYRKDLFKAANLPAPDNWEAISHAAQTLHNPPAMSGISLATDGTQIYTQQVFEYFALSNDVRLLDAAGNIHLNEPRMVETLDFYKSLAQLSPPADGGWRQARTSYLNGRAAMIVWSPFILEALAGLNSDLPVIPDKENGAGYLAKNSGFISTIIGPHGAAQYGQIGCLGISSSADPGMAKQWVGYLLNEGYVPWLSMAPEGKLPLRRGTSEGVNQFVESWINLDIGVTSRAKLSKCYSKPVLRVLISSINKFDHWGFPAGKGAIAARIYAQRIIPNVLAKFLNDEITAKQAAREMKKRIKALK